MRLQAGFSPAMQMELASIGRMGSASLRDAVDALALNKQLLSSNESEAVMKAVCERATAIKSDMRYWDVVKIVQAYAAVVSKPSVSSDELSGVATILHGKVSQLSVKHLLDVMLALEQAGIRPQALMTEIANRLIDITKSSMYADELVALLRIVARCRLGSKFVDAIVSAVLINEDLLAQLRFLHSCEVLGALASVGRIDQRLITKLEQKCEIELQVMPLEELWRTTTAFPRLAYSYSPLETMAHDRMREVVSGITASQFDEVTRPMEFLQFLRFRDLLSDDAIISACKWANDAVYRPATRTQAFRRPTIFEVAVLADFCAQRGISSDRIEKAITVTVTSKGGTVDRVAKPKPLRYRRRRSYIRELDGYAALQVKPVCSVPAESLSNRKTSDAAFAPKLRAEANGVPLWKTRSGPWFFRK